MEKTSIEEKLINVSQHTHDRRKGCFRIAIASISVAVVLFIILMVSFHIFPVSSDYRDRVLLAIEIADMIIDGNITANEAFEEHVFVALEGIGDPTGRREGEIAQQFITFVGDVTRIAISEAYLSSLILIEDRYDSSYGRSFEVSYNNTRNHIDEFINDLLHTRNQLADSIGIEQRQAIAN
jgi:hypothetical protein